MRSLLRPLRVQRVRMLLRWLTGAALLGFLPSDHCFDRFISPLSNPFFFEDPRSLTEARAIFIDNKLPATLGGSDLDVWSGQLAVACRIAGV